MTSTGKFVYIYIHLYIYIYIYIYIYTHTYRHTHLIYSRTYTLTALAQPKDVEKDFQFEISPYPPSLFKDILMRQPDKPTLFKKGTPPER